MNILTFVLSIGIFSFARTDDETCYDKFEYVFKVMHRLSEVVKKLEHFQETKLEKEDTRTLSQGDTFTRWGRFSCPNGTTLIYEGFAGGSEHGARDSAANYVCLHKQPTWNDNNVYKSQTNLMHGAEYQTGSTNWDKIYEYDVPCVVCHVPSSNIVIIPGRNVCHEKHSLQYSGYLMSGHDSNTSETEFVCVDDEREFFLIQVQIIMANFFISSMQSADH
ncbi:uncharacterized protein LOC132744268 [Ruditapes philippinarum]|uniref:uncharacterized protein LOC132744268 n=1 Tax=Ruditapes philippinarum TaxID=129788 RepID=UPI00295ABCFC|nr:uncharacterized protein LOC132744268 [Ruditapes philippinarum]